MPVAGRGSSGYGATPTIPTPPKSIPDDGTLVLVPVLSISPLELAALQDPAVMAAVAAAKVLQTPAVNSVSGD
jgi:hypothetical protein